MFLELCINERIILKMICEERAYEDIYGNKLAQNYPNKKL
jgi:hypothetical protein